MDYTVGSLADLISGQDTPNKPKVTKIAIKTIEDEHQNSTIPETFVKKKKKISDTQITKPKKRKAKDTPTKNIKKRKTDVNSFADSEEETIIKPEENEEAEGKKKIKKKIKVQNPEEQARTIFVGNVPLKSEKKKIKRHFKKYGPIESLRFRGIPVANPKVPKKVAAIKKEFHPDRNSLYCYIRFVEKEDAQKALKENGGLFQEHHLSVQPCDIKEKPDESKAIFIGNLSFNAEEEDLWKIFESCGPISNIRIIRDSYTGMGKGFAYINFKDSDGVQLALEMENVKLGNRELRISPSSVSSAKKNKKNNKQKTKAKPRWRNKQQIKKNDNNNKNGNADKVNNNSEKPNNVQNKSFQGSKFNPKKKNKVNKGLLEKKRNVKKIAPISN